MEPPSTGGTLPQVTAEGHTEAAAIGAGLVVLVILLAVSRSRRQVCAFAVGATGVLMGVQVVNAHLFTIAVVAWLCTTRSPASRQWPRVLFLAASILLCAVSVVFGDLVNSPTLALQLAALAGSGALVALRATSEDVTIILRAALLVISLGSMMGLLQVVGVVPLETWHEDISTLGRPLGIWPEPDWLGLMAAIGVVLAWRLELRTLYRVLALTLCFAAFILAFARAAWIALAIAVVTLIIARRFTVSGQDHAGRGRRAAVVTLACSSMVAFFASSALRSDLVRRLGTLVSADTDDVSGQARLQQTASLLHLADTAAPFGHGLSSSGRVGVSGALYLSVNSDNNVASNWLLGLWVDAALLAIPLILFLGYFALRGVTHLPGQVLLLILANSLFSNALFQPVTWLFVGLTLLATAPRVRLRTTASAAPRLDSAREIPLEGRTPDADWPRGPASNSGHHMPRVVRLP
jgi:hypothetical protein